MYTAILLLIPGQYTVESYIHSLQTQPRQMTPEQHMDWLKRHIEWRNTSLTEKQVSEEEKTSMAAYKRLPTSVKKRVDERVAKAKHEFDTIEMIVRPSALTLRYIIACRLSAAIAAEQRPQTVRK